MLEARWCKYQLHFKFLAKTSREEMREKTTYFVKVFDSDTPYTYGIGECALFKGLSSDDVPDYEHLLSQACLNMTGLHSTMSSIRMGFETAIRDLHNGGHRQIFLSEWLSGQKDIHINGLIWMGDKSTMLNRIREKIEHGFRILKLKIGGIDFEEELSILKSIRDYYNQSDLEIRLDANGGFIPENALAKLNSLSKYEIHSIEQPIAAGQYEAMRTICHESPIAIALDEDLIGFNDDEAIDRLLTFVRPRYIILKPTLCGGFERSDKWIESAETKGIGWWATSALESNIGLNAIAQWVATKKTSLAQGLGTGMLYTNNIQSPLELKSDRLAYNPNQQWCIPHLEWQL